MLLPNKSRKSVFEENAFEWHEAFGQTNSRQFFKSTVFQSVVFCQFSCRFRKDFIRPKFRFRFGLNSVPEFFFELLRVTVWLCGVRDFETLHSQAATEPIRLFIYLFYSQIVKDELALLLRRTAVELPAVPRITYSFCYALVLFWPFICFSIFKRDSQFYFNHFIIIRLKGKPKFFVEMCGKRTIFIYFPIRNYVSK